MNVLTNIRSNDQLNKLRFFIKKRRKVITINVYKGKDCLKILKLLIEYLIPHIPSAAAFDKSYKK